MVRPLLLVPVIRAIVASCLSALAAVSGAAVAVRLLEARAPRVAEAVAVAPSPSTSPARPQPAHREPGEPIVLSRAELDAMLSAAGELTTTCRIVPAFERGKTIGFKVFSVRAGSVWEMLGLENGDVVTRIGDLAMTSPEQGLEMYTRLKEATDVHVDLVRRGVLMSLDYVITP